MTPQLRNILNTLKNSSSIRKECVKLNYTNASKELIKLIYESGLIQSFKIINDSQFSHIIINLRYSQGFDFFKNLKTFSFSTNTSCLTYKQLCRLNIRQALVVLATSQGFKTLDDCKRLKIGGVLCFII